jgi:hypothetical protein
MLAIMELLCFEQSLDLVWNGVIRVIAEIRGYFVCRREDRGTNPTRYIQDFLISGLLGHLYWVDSPHWIKSASASFRSEPFSFTH